MQEKRSFLTKNRAINQKFCSISAKRFFDSFNRREANNAFSCFLLEGAFLPLSEILESNIHRLRYKALSYLTRTKRCVMLYAIYLRSNMMSNYY